MSLGIPGDQVRKCYRISGEEDGLRLDRFLKNKVPEISRRVIIAWIAEKKVRCDGRIANKGIRLREGMQVETEFPVLVEHLKLIPEIQAELEVLFEDSFLVAVDKPPGIATCPLTIGEQGTVANVLAEQYPEMQSIGFSRLEAGLLHRLDRDTSGVLLAARRTSAFEQLRDQFDQQRVLKIYSAVVQGCPDRRGSIDLSIGSKNRRAERVIVFHGQMQRRHLRNLCPAETSYQVLKTCDTYSLIRLVMKTGARHQLRAHMAHLGTPVVGDRIYGTAGNENNDSNRTTGRQLLHASEIHFFHPEDGRLVKIRSPFPSDFQAFLKTHKLNRV